MDVLFWGEMIGVPLVVICGFIFFAVRMRKGFKMLAEMKQRDLNWYRKEHPNHVEKNKITCHQCDGANIGTERLLGNTFLRRHMCRTCGTALYYSPEI